MLPYRVERLEVAMGPLNCTRSHFKSLIATLGGVLLSISASEGAFAKSSGPAIEARVALAKLVRIAAMQADYSTPVEALTNRQCQDEAAVKWVADAATGMGEFPRDYHRLCRLAHDGHADKNSRTITVPAKFGASCDEFRKSFSKIISSPSEFKLVSTHSIAVESTEKLKSKSDRFYQLKLYSIDCGTKYSVTFPYRRFYQFF
jgi:hypothetical protein